MEAVVVEEAGAMEVVATETVVVEEVLWRQGRLLRQEPMLR